MLALKFQERDELTKAIANYNQPLANTPFYTNSLALKEHNIASKHPGYYPEMTRLIQQLTKLGMYLHVTNADKLQAGDPILVAASKAWFSTSRMAQSVLHRPTTFNSPKYINMLSETLEKTMNLMSNPHDASTMQALLAQSEFNRQTLEGPSFLRGLRASRYADSWYQACKDTLDFTAKVIFGCTVTTFAIGWIPFLPFEIITGFAILGLIVAGPIFALAALGTLIFREKDRHFGLSKELSPQNAKDLHELAKAIQPANYKEATKTTMSKFKASVSGLFSKAPAKSVETDVRPAAPATAKPLYPSLS